MLNRRPTSPTDRTDRLLRDLSAEELSHLLTALQRRQPVSAPATDSQHCPDVWGMAAQGVESIISIMARLPLAILMIGYVEEVRR